MRQTHGIRCGSALRRALDAYQPGVLIGILLATRTRGTYERSA
jgi:hypothetical protein